MFEICFQFYRFLHTNITSMMKQSLNVSPKIPKFLALNSKFIKVQQLLGICLLVCHWLTVKRNVDLHLCCFHCSSHTYPIFFRVFGGETLRYAGQQILQSGPRFPQNWTKSNTIIHKISSFVFAKYISIDLNKLKMKINHLFHVQKTV